MIVIPEVADASTIYVAYRAQPVLATMPESLLRLTALGATAQLMLLEEAKGLGPDESLLDRRLQAGARARSGAVLWERFLQTRHLMRLQLLEDEERFVSYVSGR